MQEPWLSGEHSDRGGRRTVGLLIEHTGVDVRGYQTTLWMGAVDAARERDANLICFAGGTLGFSPLNEYERQRNRIYDLVAAPAVDGLVVSGGSLGNFVSAQELDRFYERYHPLPIVSIAYSPPEIPSVLVDNEAGMRAVLTHLIETHGYRRIAFIRGPEGVEDADRRYHVYVEVLDEHEIPVDLRLVVPGDFMAPSGAAAIRLLLDERDMGFDAVVAANDNMALGAMEALRARGIRVPYDLAVVGFDDQVDATSVAPSLTTVRQPIYEQARQAVTMLLDLLAGREVQQRVVLHAELIVRESCGCVSPAIVRSSAGRVRQEEAGSGDGFEGAKQEILAELGSVARDLFDGPLAGNAERLLDAFISEMDGAACGVYLPALDEILRQTAATGGDLGAWQEVLSALRRGTLAWLQDSARRAQAENLWQQARVMLAEAMRREGMSSTLQAERRAQALREVSQALITTFDVVRLTDALAEQAARLQIPSAYLGLYEDPEQPVDRARLVLARRDGRRVPLESTGVLFAPQKLLPEGMLPQDRRYAMVVEPLYLGESQSGFAIFEVGPREGTLYEALGGQLGSALHGALLVRHREELLASLEKRNTQLQTAIEVSHAASSVLDPDELIQHAVELIRDRFGLYYVGLFLVDSLEEGATEQDSWAVLHAGTGDPGRQMLLRGHRLRVGGASMIGQCVALGQARIALDVGDEPQRFDNPWLPDTRSEIALPLASRGRTIGALTIQSTREAAYSREDVLALQAMADQLATAIDTARLFEETRARAERERIVRSVADRVRRGVDSDAIVRTALQELGKMLGSSRSIACLNPREQLLSLGGPPRDEQGGSQSRSDEP